MLGSNKKRWITGAVVALAIVAGGAGIAVATGATGDDDQPLTGETLQRATDAALQHTGGGVVTETEAGDDGAAYGVEVRLPDGTQVEVNLDAGFNVIGQEVDDDGAGDEDTDGDD
jgi:uncharacterized membrane protein YkoI